MRSIPWTYRILAAAAVAAACVGIAWGCPPLPSGPVGVIDLRAEQWDAVKFGPYNFQRNPNISGTLRDIAPGDQYWLARGTTAITTLRGAAHNGYSGAASQAEADARVAKIQIWAWRDTNGNGRADPGDTTTEWTLVSEITPGVAGAHVVGYDVPLPHAIVMPDCASSVGDVLQAGHGGTTITVGPGQSWLFLIRVVSATEAGCTNLVGTSRMENWDDGNGNGSGVTSDKYIAADGKWCEASEKDGQQAVADHSIVWIYVPK
jgi:hypothetical protein